MLHTSVVLVGVLCRAGVEAGSPLGSGAAHPAAGVAAPNLSSSDGKGEEPESDGAALWQLLQSKATNHTTQRRRAQNNFGNLAAAGPGGGGGPIVGASADGPIPTAVTDGIFVLDLERHTSMQVRLSDTAPNPVCAESTARFWDYVCDCARNEELLSLRRGRERTLGWTCMAIGSRTRANQNSDTPALPKTVAPASGSS